MPLKKMTIMRLLNMHEQSYNFPLELFEPAAAIESLLKHTVYG